MRFRGGYKSNTSIASMTSAAATSEIVIVAPRGRVKVKRQCSLAMQLAWRGFSLTWLIPHNIKNTTGTDNARSVKRHGQGNLPIFSIRARKTRWALVYVAFLIIVYVYRVPHGWR